MLYISIFAASVRKFVPFLFSKQVSLIPVANHGALAFAEVGSVWQEQENRRKSQDAASLKRFRRISGSAAPEIVVLRLPHPNTHRSSPRLQKDHQQMELQGKPTRSFLPFLPEHVPESAFYPTPEAPAAAQGFLPREQRRSASRSQSALVIISLDTPPTNTTPSRHPLYLLWRTHGHRTSSSRLSWATPSSSVQLTYVHPKQ